MVSLGLALECESWIDWMEILAHEDSHLYERACRHLSEDQGPQVFLGYVTQRMMTSASLKSNLTSQSVIFD